jgi:acetoacetate decarboxylase
MTADRIAVPAFSMPRTAPLYPAPPYRYEGNQSINVLFRTTPETLRKLVPAPLAPNPDGLLFLYIAQFQIVAPMLLSYLEAGIGAPVALGDMPGNYGVVLYLDTAVAIIAGREIFGWPKKDAEITFTEDGNLVSGRVVRDGVVLIDATVHRSAPMQPIPEEPSVPWYNLKIIPSARKGAPPDVLQLTSLQLDTETKQLFMGPATLSLGSTALDPLGDIPIMEILGGRWALDGFTMGHGDVVHDYLA